MLLLFDMFASDSIAMQVINGACLANRFRMLVPEEVETGVFEHEVGRPPVGATASFMAKLVQVPIAIWFRYLVWSASGKHKGAFHIWIILLCGVWRLARYVKGISLVRMLVWLVVALARIVCFLAAKHSPGWPRWRPC